MRREEICIGVYLFDDARPLRQPKRLAKSKHGTRATPRFGKRPISTLMRSKVITLSPAISCN
jgi:hypothetical protein